MAGSTYFVGIAGASCSGKGHLCEYLKKKLSPSTCLVFPIDCYYRDVSHDPAHQQYRHNFDTPAALDHDLFIKHLRALAAGGTVDMPSYDFHTHTRTKDTRCIQAEGKIVLIEGLFALYWEEVRQLLSTKIFINLDSKTCMARRIERDVRERGRTPESVKQQFSETVLPMYERHVAPTRRYADLVLQGDASVDELGAKVVGLIT